MAKRYDHRHNNIIHIHKNIFLPMFCRLSINDVTLDNYTRPKNHADPKHEPAGRARRSREKKSRRAPRVKIEIDDQDDCNRAGRVDIAEMDPPLPVKKTVATKENIWKRRFNGVGGGLTTLEIQTKL